MFSAVSDFQAEQGGVARHVCTVVLRVARGSMHASINSHTSASGTSCNSERSAKSLSLMPPEKSRRGAGWPATSVGGARGCCSSGPLPVAGTKAPHSVRHLGAAVKCRRSRPMEAKSLTQARHTVSLGSVYAPARQAEFAVGLSTGLYAPGGAADAAQGTVKTVQGRDDRMVNRQEFGT